METKRQSAGRSILFWVFFLSSFPIAVVLISYASGFRIDRNTGTVVAQAAISVETTPRDATVRVNGEELKKTTPVVESLTPGMYTMTITKDGYQDWEKNITVHRGESELFSDVLLFSLETPIASSQTLTKPAFEPFRVDQRNLQILDGPEALIVDSRYQASFVVDSREQRETRLKIDTPVTTAQWNANESLVYATRNGLWVYTVGGDTQMLRRQSLRILDVAWHPNNAYIFYSDLTGIYAMELDSRDNRQRWKIADVADAKDLVVNDNGDRLQFQSKNQFYSLKLY